MRSSVPIATPPPSRASWVSGTAPRRRWGRCSLARTSRSPPGGWRRRERVRPRIGHRTLPRSPRMNQTPQMVSLLGRDAQPPGWLAALDGARAGRGRLFLLVGEAGIGKTRLADELAARAGEDVRVLWGR